MLTWLVFSIFFFNLCVALFVYLNFVVPKLEEISGEKLDASALKQMGQYEEYALICEKENNRSLPYRIAKNIRIYFGIQAILLFIFVFLLVT